MVFLSLGCAVVGDKPDKAQAYQDELEKLGWIVRRSSLERPTAWEAGLAAVAFDNAIKAAEVGNSEEFSGNEARLRLYGWSMEAVEPDSDGETEGKSE